MSDYDSHAMYCAMDDDDPIALDKAVPNYNDTNRNAHMVKTAFNSKRFSILSHLIDKGVDLDACNLSGRVEKAFLRDDQDTLDFILNKCNLYTRDILRTLQMALNRGDAPHANQLLNAIPGALNTPSKIESVISVIYKLDKDVSFEELSDLMKPEMASLFMTALQEAAKGQLLMPIKTPSP